MTMDTAIGRNRLIARSTPGRAHRIGNFAVVCIFSIAGLILSTLAIALIGFKELAQILAVAG